MAELTDPPSGKPLVLRVEISAEGGELSVPALEAGLRALAPTPAAAPVADEELERREAELERRAAKLDEAERRLNERELELEAGSGHTVSEKIRLASREKRIAQIEEELEGRLRDVDEREDALETREAEFEADVELREQRIERCGTTEPRARHKEDDPSASNTWNPRTLEAIDEAQGDPRSRVRRRAGRVAGVRGRAEVRQARETRRDDDLDDNDVEEAEVQPGRAEGERRDGQRLVHRPQGEQARPEPGRHVGHAHRPRGREGEGEGVQRRRRRADPPRPARQGEAGEVVAPRAGV